MTYSLPSSSSEYVSYSADGKRVDYDSESESELRTMECGCCCNEFPFENIVECTDGHQFCFGCVRRELEEIIYGNYEARGYLLCMYTCRCIKPIPLSEIHRALPNDVIERYELREAEAAILEAKLENLVYCPFCGIPCEVDKCVQVMVCPNPECLKSSCIQCKEPSHLPLLCEENERISDTSHRRRVEERMTKAVVRECKTCKAELVKIDGCNSLKCTRCRTTMCYVCRQTINYPTYSHFCNHFLSNREPGKPCKICNKTCLLYEDEIEDNVALDAKEEALKELDDKEPNLLHRNIGPPLERPTLRLHGVGRELARNLRRPARKH